MLKALLSAMALAEVKARVEIATQNAILSLVASLLGIVAAGFLVAALFLTLLIWMDALLACLVMAAIFLIIAGIVYSGRRKPRKVTGQGPGAAAMMGALGGTVATRADAPDPSRPAPPRPPEGKGGGLFDKVPGGAMTVLPVVAFLAALLAARRRP